ncbi:uncharacterized protein LOC133789120 isoform X3 [Humulus lupulus]|uniref:uncharacterized protein LOC133789120 isoform X3 n=1 Tax=Humulus lupulus TaxID=3486 RepID=UPI002B400646|nr:uncharacterized protein LOC133789120 isoform X3 [Humulus lupulus]
MKERRNASLIEIKNLQRLTVLYLNVQSEEVLPEGLFSKKLERYQISIGGIYNFDYAGGSSRCLHLNLYQRKELNALGLVWLMKMSEYLSLERLMDVNNFVRDLDRENFPRLKHLMFYNNDGVQYVIDSTDLIHSHHAFPCLESLTLGNLTSLERICHGKLPVGSFKELRKVVLWKCDRLKNLFPLSIIKLLHYVNVSECEMMEEIANGREDDEDAHKIESLQLCFLCLRSLPNFVHFYCSKLKETCASSMIDYSKPLFSETVLFPNLKELTIWEISIEKIWPNQLSSGSFMQNLTSLEVESCNSLKYLFSFSLAQKLLNLKKLEVRYCIAMEDIGVTNKKLGEEDTQLENILFPKLDSIELCQLSALQRFCARNSCMEFPLLSKLIVNDCQELKIFVSCPTIPISEVSIEHREVNQLVSTQPFFNEKVSLPNLKELEILKINAVTLWPDQLPSNFDLHNLTSLTIENCNKIKYLFCFPMVERLVNLKMLDIDDCLVVEEILISGKLGEKGMLQENILFSKLEALSLSKLPAFETFCSEDSSIKEISIDDYEGKVIAKHLCNGKVIFPNLKDLTTDWSEVIEEIFDTSQSSMMSIFGNLSQLVLNCSSRDKPIALPNFNFFHKYHNIDTLGLSGYFVDGHQHHQQQQSGDGETYELVNTSLKTLGIFNAYMMNHLFGDPEYAQPSNSFVFQNLEFLNVQECSRLQSVAPSFMSFHTLKTLKVSKCHGLTYLLASSAAASLVHLKEMSITECKRMREIINRNYYKEGQTVESEHHEFIFQKLEKLELHDLPSLESFYSGNKVVSFPNLEEIYLKGCPEMKRFSHGNICTSTLLDTVEAEGVQIWEGDVNTTLAKIWEENSDFRLHLQHLFAQEMDDQHREEDA